MTVFNWRDFLTFAEAQVADAASGEAASRSAVSRGYYAVFNLAREYLASRERIEPTRADSHDQVWLALEDGSAAERRIGQGGRRLRYWRNWADYESDFPQVTRDAANLVALARRVAKEIDALL